MEAGLILHLVFWNVLYNSSCGIVYPLVVLFVFSSWCPSVGFFKKRTTPLFMRKILICDKKDVPTTLMLLQKGLRRLTASTLTNCKLLGWSAQEDYNNVF